MISNANENGIRLKFKNKMFPVEISYLLKNKNTKKQFVDNNANNERKRIPTSNKPLHS